jgi:hypothetical protein
MLNFPFSSRIIEKQDFYTIYVVNQKYERAYRPEIIAYLRHTKLSGYKRLAARFKASGGYDWQIVSESVFPSERLLTVAFIQMVGIPKVAHQAYSEMAMRLVRAQDYHLIAYGKLMA